MFSDPGDNQELSPAACLPPGGPSGRPAKPGSLLSHCTRHFPSDQWFSFVVACLPVRRLEKCPSPLQDHMLHTEGTGALLSQPCPQRLGQGHRCNTSKAYWGGHCQRGACGEPTAARSLLFPHLGCTVVAVPLASLRALPFSHLTDDKWNVSTCFWVKMVEQESAVLTSSHDHVKMTTKS